MDFTTTFEKVRHALSEVANVPLTSISPDIKLAQELGLDSISVVVLSIVLEEEFKESILLYEWVVAAEDHNQLTVQSLVEYVHNKLAESI